MVFQFILAHYMVQTLLKLLVIDDYRDRWVMELIKSSHPYST